MRSIIDLLIFLFFLFIGMIGKFIGKRVQDNKKKNIRIDEFDDIEEIKKREMKEKKEMECESQLLKKYIMMRIINQ